MMVFFNGPHIFPAALYWGPENDKGVLVLQGSHSKQTGLGSRAWDLTL